ncbi:hypothetical protein OAN24_06395, partial [Pseudodesulfovibrio sp.]|nr:hypothetical protein [Pseudodesulfovibrio sp.]
MKCPRCGEAMHPKSATCKNCGARIVRKNEALARKMTTNSRVAMAVGGFLVILAGVLAFNGAYLFG